jgi:hypothetical protein
MEELMAYFSLIRHGPQRKTKNYGETETNTNKITSHGPLLSNDMGGIHKQGDLISFLTKIRGTHRRNRYTESKEIP